MLYHALHVRPSELGVLPRESAPIGPPGLPFVDQFDEFTGEVNRAGRNTLLATFASLNPDHQPLHRGRLGHGGRGIRIDHP